SYVLLCRRLHSSTLFPYTTLFRSTGKHFIHVNGKAWPKGTSEPFATFDASTRDPSKNIWPSWIGNNAYEFLQQTDLDEIYFDTRSEEHTSELQSRENLVCRLLLEK